MKTKGQINTQLSTIETKLNANAAVQARFSKSCDELFELKRKALDLIVEKAQLNFELSGLM